MKSFLNKLVAKKQEKQLTALEQYRELLTRQDELTEADEDTLEQVIDELGYTPDQVERDAATMTRVAELQPTADDLDNRLKANKAASSAMVEAEKKRGQLVAEGQNVWARAENQRQVTSGKVMEANIARDELNQLRQKHPHLFP